MGKKLSGWKTKGMNRDMSVSAFNNEFAYENLNLRLATNENNTLMSWVNERGTKLMTLNIEENPWREDDEQIVETHTIKGTPIGTAVINHKLVLFTTYRTGDNQTFDHYPDYIYTFEFDDTHDDVLNGKIIYKGNLNFCTTNPLETLVSYEANYIEKVYWIDNRNQPRIINIASPKEKMQIWNSTQDYDVVDTFFDFVPAIKLNEEVTITKDVNGSGTYAPGVIQYAFTYINKYAQESNIFYVSPLYYLSHADRGASPEERVSCSFSINIEGLDNTFDIVRIYSIQRTSLDLDPIVKQIEDIPIAEITDDNITTYSIFYIDNGTTGSTVDPYKLLYVGGKEIQALTMTQKDNTLFLGGITERNTLTYKLQDYFNKIRDPEEEGHVDVEFVNKNFSLSSLNGFYSYNNSLKKKSSDITTFKGGETYRFGFQLQKVTGEWLDPIFIDDKANEYYPVSSATGPVVKLYKAQATINFISDNQSIIIDDGGNPLIDTSIYKNIRPVIVYPNIQDRTVVCQGVLNPTVFNVLDRINGTPYSQASWFFRPFAKYGEYTNGYEEIRTIINSNRAINITTPAPDNVVITVNSYFVENNLTEDAYVLIVDFDSEEAVKKVLERKTIFVRSVDYIRRGPAIIHEENKEEIEYKLDAVYLGPIENETKTLYRYALIRYNGAWPEECKFGDATKEEYDETTGNYSGEIVSYSDIAEYKESISTPVSIWKSDEKTGSIALLQYIKPEEDAPDEYDLGFISKALDTYYEITFTTMASILRYGETNNAGIVSFQHYCSLPTEGPNAEIQGAINVKATDLTLGSTGSGGFGRRNTSSFVSTESSNTQFYVDSSIVTFNSPDLEFDTTVQKLDGENLTLKVIGVIPITGNASAHRITTDSAMLEEYYNVNTAPKTHNNIIFPKGELPYFPKVSNISWSGINRLITESLWNDIIVVSKDAKHKEDQNNDNITTTRPIDYYIYPWQRSGSLNNDWRTKATASSWLKSKKESTLLFSSNSIYVKSISRTCNFNHISYKVHLAENAEIINIKLKNQTAQSSSINYYPNIDKVLYNTNGYYATDENGPIDRVREGSTANFKELPKLTTPVSMKYKSNSHAVIALNGTISDPSVPVLPYLEANGYHMHGAGWVNINAKENSLTYYWGDTIKFTQAPISKNDFNEDSGFGSYGFLWLGEICKPVTNRFGGNSEEAVLNNSWLPAGEVISLTDSNGDLKENITLVWDVGDTYYQRYDCLKTYPYTTEDPNQIVEILSFMCETRVNIDGRFDNKRGQIINYNMMPENFNILNPVYSQKDNYFSYKKIDKNKDEDSCYPNYISYSETKNTGSDVDAYTHVTLASVLELEGDKGSITSLQNLNGQILSFQENGIAQILYNENYQIQTTQGVPIEIANSGKVQGSRYLSNTVGCSNKWSIVQTPSGIYFMDSDEQSIYLFNGQLNNISTSGGMNTWCKQNIPSIKNLWTPDNFKNFVSYYDPYNQDVMFINEDTALAFSEKLNAFTSFYDYGKTPYFCSLDNTGLWVRNSRTGNDTDTYNIYKHQAGDYCKFFGENRPYHTILVGNPEPQTDKIFTNLEFRATVDGDGSYNPTTKKFTPALPFDYLEAWNEYQHGITKLEHKSGAGSMSHNMDSNPSTLKRKFRIWRCDIPRDNTPASASQSPTDVNRKYTLDSKLGISRYNPRKLDRIRNPWVYIKLLKEAPLSGHLERTEVHDILMTFFS